MGYTTLNKFDVDGHVTKYDNYKTKNEAQARIVELHAMGFSDAFYIDMEATRDTKTKLRCFDDPQHFIADKGNKTVSFDKESYDKEVAVNATLVLRNKRNTVLTKSDNYVLPDRWASMTAEKQAEWSKYRQDLRDLPASTADPINPTWPTEPE